MKKKVLSFRLLAIVLVSVMLLSVASPAGSEALAATKYRLSRSQLTLYVGDSETLTLLLAPKKKAKSIKWTSSKKTVVTVTKGKLKAKKAGKAKITAKLSGKKYNCTVTVKNPKIKYVEKPVEVPVPVPVEPEAPAQGNQIYQSDVTRDMTKASYWYNKCDNPDAVLMDREQIEAQNQKNFAASAETCMTDLKTKALEYDGSRLKTNLSNALISEVRDDRCRRGADGKYGRASICRDGKKLSDSELDAWFDEMKSNIDNAAATTADKRKYAVCVKRADLWMAPTDALVGWGADDADSEFINSALNVNEPVLIDVTTADGKYSHITGTNCDGWVLSECFAVCEDRQAWIDQWDPSPADALVVTGSHITLEQSNLRPKTSAVDLYLGTVLPLVPKEAFPADLGERSSWYGYTVYIPTRSDDGKMVREAALISSHHEVSIGYPEMTQKNIIKIAFSCLGDRYGWGGMLGAMDCSLYARNIYRCFGLELPRNTTWQVKMPSYKVDLSPLYETKTDSDGTELKDYTKKAEAIKLLAPGSLLMFSGHIMMYLGEDNGKLYVISDLGSMKETAATGDDTKYSIYDVCINSLDVRRASGNTWLADLLWGVTPFQGN